MFGIVMLFTNTFEEGKIRFGSFPVQRTINKCVYNGCKEVRGAQEALRLVLLTAVTAAKRAECTQKKRDKN